MVKAYFERNPEERDRLVEMLLNKRVFDWLGGRFTVVEKTREDLEREREERLAAEKAAREAEEAARLAVEAEAARPKGLFERMGFSRRKK
jgi:hypothetical protein